MSFPHALSGNPLRSVDLKNLFGEVNIFIKIRNYKDRTLNTLH